MLPDLLAENNGSRIVYIANITHGFVAKNLSSHSQLSFPHSGAFISLLEDYAAGMLCMCYVYLLYVVRLSWYSGVLRKDESSLIKICMELCGGCCIAVI